jgi:hypothetical protein
MNSAENTIANLSASVILCLILWICAALRIGYTQMDTMLEHLKNSSAVKTMAFLRKIRPRGVLLLVGGISGFVTFPSFYIKRGTIDAKDIENFPAPLKHKLIILQWSVILLLSCMTAFFLLEKSGWLS